jgi:branched-chain amino acid transport system ATP-binding protein
MLSGHVEPSAGRVVFRGEDITALAPHDRARRGLARTYQVPRPFGQMTVFDNLRVAAVFAGGLSGLDATEWIERTLAATGLTRYADTLAGRLPLLVRKRHELARALAMRPQLLLIDEVAAGLTEQEVGEFIELVRRIRDTGVTMVWIEHVIRTMLTATDRLMALAGGRILALGAPQDVIKHAGGQACLPRHLRPPGDKPVLRVASLSAYYGELRAIYDISLDLFRGDVLAIIGANGAGKSTLLKSLTG